MWKRTSLFILSLAVILSMITVPALAADVTEYYFDELNLSVSVPSKYEAVTRDTTELGSAVSSTGKTLEQVQSFLTENNHYLYLLPSDFSSEMTFTYEYEETLQDIYFSSTPDSELSELSNDMCDSFIHNLGATIISTDIHKFDKLTFLSVYMSFPLDGSTAYCSQYYTMCGGPIIYITMRSYGTPITDTQFDELEEIAASIAFHDKQDGTVLSSPFVFQSEEIGLTFTIPAGWYQDSFTEGASQTSGIFLSETSETGFLVELSYLWDFMTDDEREGRTEQEVAEESFTVEDAAFFLETTANRIQTVDYNGYPFFSLVEEDYTFLLCKHNGYIILLMFSLTDSETSQREYTTIMNSVQLDHAVTPEPSTAVPSAPQPSDSSIPSSTVEWVSSLIKLLLNLVLTVVIYLLPIIIYRFGVRKHPLGKKNALVTVIVYGLTIWILLSILTYLGTGTLGNTGAALFWSIVNFFILTRGKDRRGGDVEIPQDLYQNPTDNQNDPS